MNYESVGQIKITRHAIVVPPVNNASLWPVGTTGCHSDTSTAVVGRPIVSPELSSQTGIIRTASVG